MPRGRLSDGEMAMQALEHCLRSGFHSAIQQRWDSGGLLAPPLSVSSWIDESRMRTVIRFLFDGREVLQLQTPDDCWAIGPRLEQVVTLRFAHILWEAEYYEICREKTRNEHREAHYSRHMAATTSEQGRTIPEFFHRLQEATDAFYERRHRGGLWTWAPHMDCFHVRYRSEADLWGAIHDHEESRGSRVNANMRQLARSINDMAGALLSPQNFISAVFRRARENPRPGPVTFPMRTDEPALVEELASTVAALTNEERIALQRQMQDSMNQQLNRSVNRVWNDFAGQGVWDQLRGLGGGGGAYSSGLNEANMAGVANAQQARMAQVQQQYYSAALQQDHGAAREYQAQMRNIAAQMQNQMAPANNPYQNGMFDAVIGAFVDPARGPEETAFAAYTRQYMVRANDMAGFRELYLGRWDGHTEAAERKGMRVLRENLNAEQLESLDHRGFFEVRGGRTGKTYRIRHGRQMNIDEVDGRGRKVCGWCFVPKGSLVAGDVMLTQKLAIELQEDKALLVANRF